MAAHSHCNYTAVASKEAGLRNGIGFLVFKIKFQISKSNLENQNQICPFRLEWQPAPHRETGRPPR